MMTDEQRARWVALCRRQAELGWRMIEPAAKIDKGEEFGLYAAEVENLNAEIDELMREILDEDGYNEYRRTRSRNRDDAGPSPTTES